MTTLCKESNIGGRLIQELLSMAVPVYSLATLHVEAWPEHSSDHITFLLDSDKHQTVKSQYRHLMLMCLDRLISTCYSRPCYIATDLQNFCTAGKCMKFATRNLHSFPPHLDYGATLPWEVKIPNLLKITKIWLKNRTVCDKNETLHVQWLKEY